MTRQHMSMIVQSHIVKYGSTPVIDELLNRLQDTTGFVIFEFEHLVAMSIIMSRYSRDQSSSKW